MIPVGYPDALHKGLGRAVLAVGPHNAQDLRPLLLDACLHNRAYDPQVEGSRAHWMMNILRRTDDVEYYVREVETALATAEASWDAEQLFELAALLVLDGHERLRGVLRAAFRAPRDPRGFTWLGRKAMLRLDGLEGLVTIADVTGARLLADPEAWEDESFLDEACEELGTEAVMERLRAAAISSPNVAAYLAATDAARARSAPGPRRPPSISFAEIESAIARSMNVGWCRTVGRRMDAATTDAAVSRLETEEDVARLARWLALFYARALPRCPERVWQLARHGDPELQASALRALRLVDDPRKLALGRELLAGDAAVRERGAIELMAQGSASDGDALLVALNDNIPADRDRHHRLLSSIAELAENDARVLTRALLLHVYEATPCATCRHTLVKRLASRGELTRDLLAECRHDASEDIRALAGNSPA